MKNLLSVAYSPDTDDAFMMWALREHLIDWKEFHFDFVTDDIEKLNQESLKGKFDITAISVATYPLIAEAYAMMPVGGSVARGKGPAVIVKEDSPITRLAQFQGLTVAVPGLHTSAALAARILLPSFQAVSVPFDSIAAAVKAETVDGGILIHELQLNPAAENLRVIGRLGELWQNHFQLPLPLGTNAIRRSLGTCQIESLTRLFRDSVRYGLNHRQEGIEFSRRRALMQTSPQAADTYISQFVNEDSLAIRPDLLSGVERLFSEGHRLNLWPTQPLEPLFCCE